MLQFAPLRKKIAEGEIVCVFPEGELERRGTLLRLQRGYEVIAAAREGQVVPVWLDQLWGSIFSFRAGNFSGSSQGESGTLYSGLWKSSRQKQPTSRPCARNCSNW